MAKLFLFLISSQSPYLQNMKPPSIKTLQANLRKLRAIFEAAGGRGVELADQIDALELQIDEQKEEVRIGRLPKADARLVALTLESFSRASIDGNIDAVEMVCENAGTFWIQSDFDECERAVSEKTPIVRLSTDGGEEDYYFRRRDLLNGRVGGKVGDTLHTVDVYGNRRTLVFFVESGARLVS